MRAGNTAAFVLNVFIVQTSNFGWYGATNGEMSRKYQVLSLVQPSRANRAFWQAARYQCLKSASSPDFCYAGRLGLCDMGAHLHNGDGTLAHTPTQRLGKRAYKHTPWRNQANAIYMNVPSQRRDDNQIVRSMSGWWISAQLLQVAWTLAFAQEQITLSCGLMYAPPTAAPRYATPRLRHTACPSF